MFILLEFFEIMDKDFDKYKKLLDLIELKLPKDVDKYKDIYVEGDKSSKDKLFNDYKKFDEELEEKISKKLKSENFKFGCCDLLRVADIEYNSSDMKDVLSKIVENRETIKKAVLERSKNKKKQ